MELRQLRYFVTVAEELNFSRAAERLHISMPPLSVQIRALENEIGAELFSRDRRRRITLTRAGKVFLEQARATLAQATLGITLARKAATEHLVVGYNEVSEFDVLPRIVPAFKRKWPDVRLTLRGLKAPDQMEALRRDELDVAFICQPICAEGVDLHELTHEPLVIGVPNNHPLASIPVVSFTALSEEPLILCSKTLDPAAFQEIEQNFVQVGSRLNIAYELESALSMIHFTAQGHGCCIVPSYARNMWCDGVSYRPLGPPTIMRTLAIVKGKGRGGLADAFYRFVIECIT